MDDDLTPSEDESPDERQFQLENVQSAIGISIGQQQTRLTSPKTPAAEKAAALDETDGLPTALIPSTTAPHQWQAMGTSRSTGERKHVIYGPIAIANHIPPHRLDWRASLTCPICEEEVEQPRDKDDEEEIYRPDEQFEDIAALQEHLEWQHSGKTLTDSLPCFSVATCILYASSRCDTPDNPR